MANLTQPAQKRKRGRPANPLKQKVRKPTALQQLREKLARRSRGEVRLPNTSFRLKQDGYVPLDEKRRIFIHFCTTSKDVSVATGLKCRKEDFNARTWTIRGDKKGTEFLQLCRGEILKIIEHLKRLGEPITPEGLKELFLSERGLVAAPTMAKALEDELQRLVKCFEAGHIRKPTLVAGQKYIARIVEWLEAKHPLLRFDQLKGSHADSFFDYFTLERRMAVSYVRKMWQAFKSATNRGIRAGWVSRDPFIGYRTPREKPKPIEYLDADELTTIERLRFTNHMLDLVRDGFLAACYSGLAHVDLRAVGEEHLVMLDGVPSLVVRRRKMETTNGAVAAIPILPPLQALIDKYADSPHRQATGRLFPVLNNQKMNLLLKSIAEIAGFKKRLVTHMGRKTYATLVANLNVSEGSLAKSLGQSSTRTTRRVYAKQFEASAVKEINDRWHQENPQSEGKQVHFTQKSA